MNYLKITMVLVALIAGQYLAACVSDSFQRDCSQYEWLTNPNCK